MASQVPSIASRSAIPSCSLPEDIIADILARLPVKPLLQFRSVCKAWLGLINSSRFISMHLHFSILKPENHSLIVHTFQSNPRGHTISLLHLDSPQTSVKLDHPFPRFVNSLELDVVCSCRGLVFLSNPPFGKFMSLWNPATKQSKDISHHTITGIDGSWGVSAGMGFNPVSDDYIVIRIVFRTNHRIRAEIYSSNSDSWREINVDLQFDGIHFKCNAIVKGKPYWVASENAWENHGWNSRGIYLVSFDVENEVFQRVPLPNIVENEETFHGVMEFKESIGVLMNTASDDWIMWTMDDETSWSKKFMFALGLNRAMVGVLGCSKRGYVIAEKTTREMFLYDAENNESRDVLVRFQGRVFGVFNYTESLVSVKGSKQVG
ncbi:hypothetical protein RJ639_028344 [Escallonia herrerae]|uniref:F-box domain-containing protein n=1 Tax=Escallonia herrerae TaxID=1293975 RepID=A0AA88X346_9ASTE|nr:hypothetical protein RJ639_028344 [Escallonia herrerae]